MEKTCRDTSLGGERIRGAQKLPVEAGEGTAKRSIQ